MADIDVLVVRYCPQGINADLWDYTIGVLSQYPINLFTWDNTEDNIGLVKARIALTQMAKAPYIVFMDFDFQDINIHFQRLVSILDRPDVGMVMAHSRQVKLIKPYQNSPSPMVHQEFQEISRLPFNVMGMRRELYDEVGGFYEGYHTAYADCDLAGRLRRRKLKIMQHNHSRVVHLGRSSVIPEKKDIWDHDHRVFDSRRRLF